MCPCLLRHLDGLYLSDKTGGNCNKMTGSSHPHAVPSRQVLLHVCVCVCVCLCVCGGGGGGAGREGGRKCFVSACPCLD